MDVAQYLALVGYYCRIGFYRKVQDLCQEATERYSDPLFTYWRAYGISPTLYQWDVGDFLLRIFGLITTGALLAFFYHLLSLRNTSMHLGISEGRLSITEGSKENEVGIFEAYNWIFL